MSSRQLSLIIYNALLPLGLVLMAPAALIKMRRRKGRWQDFGQRLGLFNDERRAAIAALPLEERMWVHAVSVGEVGVARKFITALLRHSPTQGVVLTSTTPTGHALALEVERAFPGRVVALVSPLDLSFVASRVLEELSPRRIVLVEGEVWPNIVAQVTDDGIPVSLINARLSHRSERGYLRWKRVISPIFNMLSLVCAQEAEDLPRWEGIGVDRDHITVTGSVKYDPQGSAPDADQVREFAAILQKTGLTDRPLLLLASTHAGEEKELALIYQQLAAKHPRLGLLVVPRHFERGLAVQAELNAIGLPSLLRSQIDTHSPTATDVLIIDSTGELKAWQEHATIVIIGKSFLTAGGQNPAEAVMAGKPVVFGPHMENFIPLVQLLLQNKGAVQVPDLNSLTPVLDQLVANSDARDKLAQAGKAALMRHDGATLRTVEAVLTKVL